MVEFQQNRYLWVQLVGLAAIPLLLDICLAGLASAGPAAGYPAAYGLQFWVIAAVGILPALAMQWLRPFYLFSLSPLALKPGALTSDQRRCLKLLKSWQIKALAVVSALLSLWVLGQLYAHAAQVTPLVTPAVGLMSAAVTFFLACTFFQISVSSLRLILVSPQMLKRVTPYEPGAIAANFSILGLQVNEILPSPAAAAPAVVPDVIAKAPNADLREPKREPNPDLREPLAKAEPFISSEDSEDSELLDPDPPQQESLQVEPKGDSRATPSVEQTVNESSASVLETRSTDADLSEE